MAYIMHLFILPWLLQGAHSLVNLPTRTQPRGIQAPAAPAIPTLPLISDWKKNNESAKWAEGHPKIWGTEEKTYEMPVPKGQSLFDASLSPDKKFMALSNSTDVRIVKFETGDIVSTIPRNATGEPAGIREGPYGLVDLRVAPGGQYDLFILSRKVPEARIYRNTRIRLSADGIPIEQPIAYKTTPKDAYGINVLFSNNGRRMLLQAEWPNSDNSVDVYDLDNATSHLVLSGHTSYVTSQSISPDGKYIVTTTYDAWAKVWDAQSGKLIHDIKCDDWTVLSGFSPDGKTLLIGIGGDDPRVQFWSIGDVGNVPVVVSTWKLKHYTVLKALWTDDGQHLALVGQTREDLVSRIIILRTNDMEVVQDWYPKNWGYGLEIVWLEAGKKLAYRVEGGLEVYDFGKNLKYRWGADDFDHYTEGRKIFVVESKKWIGGVDGDQKVRFWPYPQ